MAPSNKISPKDVKKKKLTYKDYAKARGPVKQKQDKPLSNLKKMLKDDQYDFDPNYGPSKTGPLIERAPRVDAKRAAKRLGKKLAKSGK